MPDCAAGIHRYADFPNGFGCTHCPTFVISTNRKKEHMDPTPATLITVIR